jgi:hypothetical protein
MTTYLRGVTWIALATLLGACGGGGGQGEEDTYEDGETDVEDVEDEESGGSASFADEVRIEPGAAYSIHIDPTGAITPDPVDDPLAGLSATCASAVEAAPAWIREDLARTLWMVDAVGAETLASEILAASELEVDEVAWSIAVTAPEVLEHILSSGHVGLFRENASAIYAVDGMLLYARLVELDEGRTTVELDGEAGTYELDPEMYYWYVVYPRAYIGLPAYFSGNFWRTMFQIDTPYAGSLVDAVATATSVGEAADAVGDWIQGFMTFGYGTNELQPVEIYMAQFGSCGQYSIITTAAAKTVFVPTASASARADDHEWNEFWDGRWIMWDNSLGEIGTNPHYPYIDWPEIMDDDLYSSGGVFGEVAHVLRFREDEFIEACDQYTGYDQEVTVTVRDASGAPVEGARVIARTAESSYHPCTWSYTGHDGAATFMLGDDLQYGFTTDHPLLGEIPPAGVDPVVRTVEGGDPLAEAAAFGTSYPRTLTDAGSPPTGDLSLALTFEVTDTIQHRVNVITEGYDLGHTYPAELEGGLVDVFIVDQAGHDAFWASEVFDAYSVFVASQDGTVDVTLPADRDWYVVLDNAWWPTSTKFVSLSVTTEL